MIHPLLATSTHLSPTGPSTTGPGGAQTGPGHNGPPGPAALPDEALTALRYIVGPGSGCADAMALHLHHRLPELDERTVARSALEETRSCCQAHLELVVRLVSEGSTSSTIAIPDPAIDHARSLIRRGVPLDVLLRTYHLGQAFLSAQTATLFGEHLPNSTLRLQATVAIDAFLFEYIDHITEKMAAIYGAERLRWHRSPEIVRAEALETIKDGHAVDERRLERQLGYTLTGHHMAFILIPEDLNCTFEHLCDEAGRIAGALEAGTPLVIPGEGSAAWAWCRAVEDFTDAATCLHTEWRPSIRARVAFANPGPGIHGFRESHFDALEVLEFAEQFPGAISPRGTLSYRSVEMVSLLTEDLQRARRFMRSRLGALAGPDPRVRDLRDTALEFLRHGRSHARASESLFLHKNTVFTRVKRAEELLGLRSEYWGIELEAALLLARLFDEAGTEAGSA